MSELDNNSESNQTISYSFTYSLDPDGFFRRQCPSCGLHFKLIIAAGNMGTLLSPVFQRIEREFGVSLNSAEDNLSESVLMTCPYCGEKSEAPSMMTDELHNYMYRWVVRDIIHPMLNRQFEEMAKRFNGRPRHRNNGFISVDISFEHTPAALPIRPISGPEPADMNKVHVLCCDQVIKILPRWLGAIYCPYCSQHLVIR